MNKKQVPHFFGVAVLAAGLAVAVPAQALTIDFLFDNTVGNDTSTGTDAFGAMLTLDDLTTTFTVDVTAYHSDGFGMAGGLVVGQSFSLNGVGGQNNGTGPFSSQNVRQDLDPNNGGLGNDFNTDNLEGGGSDDELLVFDFGMAVAVDFFEFNTGGGHDNPEIDFPSDVDFSIAFSTDGNLFEVLLDEQVPDDGTGLGGVLKDTIDVSAASTNAYRYWVVYADSPEDIGYIEAVRVTKEVGVPEPATLAMLGVGLLGLGFRTRRRRTT